MQRLTEDQIAIRDRAREFVRRNIAPYAAQWDQTATVPMETVRQGDRSRASLPQGIESGIRHQSCYSLQEEVYNR